LTIISGLKLAREIMDTLAARQQMVDQQIRTWEVLDPRVLGALSDAARSFVPPEYRELAFADAPIPIAFGQSMLAPKVQGRILQALAVVPATPCSKSAAARATSGLSRPARRRHAFDRYPPGLVALRKPTCARFPKPGCSSRLAMPSMRRPGRFRRDRRHRLAAGVRPPF
jgi:hypothetical protein